MRRALDATSLPFHSQLSPFEIQWSSSAAARVPAAVATPRLLSAEIDHNEMTADLARSKGMVPAKD